MVRSVYQKDHSGIENQTEDKELGQKVIGITQMSKDEIQDEVSNSLNKKEDQLENY